MTGDSIILNVVATSSRYHSIRDYKLCNAAREEMFRRRRAYRSVDVTSDAGDDELELLRQQQVDDRSRYTSEISSSLSLQILIYYNGLLSAAYFVLEGGLVVDKLYHYKFGSSLHKTILGPVFAFWTIAEMHRMYFGFKGNIKEMVPHMCAFLLITLFPQLLCLTFLAFFQEHCFPIDSIIGSLQIGFLVGELFLGYYGIKAIINKRTAQFFRVAQEEVLARPGGDWNHPRAL